jgi:DNA-binding NarL/FixJ family response regulator
MNKKELDVSLEIFKEIDRKLDILIKLLGAVVYKGSSQTEAILELNKRGLANRDIGLVTGAADTTVGARIAEAKKKTKK